MRLSQIKNRAYIECIILAPPFWLKLSNYLTKNNSLRKVEIEVESPSTPIHSALTGKRPHMEMKPKVTTVPVLFILDILWLYYD